MKTRGKPAGAKSTIAIRFGDLQRLVPLGENTIIHVGTTWLKNLGIIVDQPIAQSIRPQEASIPFAMEKAEVAEKIEVADFDFDS